MNLDWRRLKAVVLESDDWGLCAWAPDEQAHRVLSDTPAWRSAAGRAFGRSTLESAGDVERLVSTLLQFRGGDGFPPVWQANTVLAAPDFERLRPPMFEVATLPLIPLPETPSRWRRPGMWDQVKKASESGVWHPELRGLHRIPVLAWLRALRRGIADARRAHEQQSIVCEVVQESGEYDPSESLEQRTANLEQAVAQFQTLFGRAPGSWCPPDYRWDDRFEDQAERLGLTVVQGKAEQAGRTLAAVRRVLSPLRWPDFKGRRFYMPARIPFQPRQTDAPRGGAEAVLRAVRAAWGRGMPAAICSDRGNYAQLDAAGSEVSRAALRDLLDRLAGDSAVFLTDVEVHELVQRGWSVRPIGSRGVLLRFYGVPREPVRFPAPPEAGGVQIKDARGDDNARVTLENGEVRAQLDPGEYLLEWRAA